MKLPKQASFVRTMTLPNNHNKEKKCLTQPTEPVANNGLDNAEGNLIVHENDVISIPKSHIVFHPIGTTTLDNDLHTNKYSSHDDDGCYDFEIQRLLGQGTFAQVFQCHHLQTGKKFAMKIVKNKPNYAKQAAVELDVFRALNENNVALQDGRVLSKKKWNDNMIELVCSFVYKDHLCLLLELLGLDLYHVLKKRRFKGFPLSAVRILVKQTLEGVIELAKRSIVHCDLRPENILLMTDDDDFGDSLIFSGGGNRRLARSAENKGSSSLLDWELKQPQESSSEKRENKEVFLHLPLMALFSGLLGGAIRTIAKLFCRFQLQNPVETMTACTAGVYSQTDVPKRIKLIDFGSSCFEGHSARTYIQARFYRSPELLLGLPYYDSAIDMWSLGFAAELFLGLPILPGENEHDQLVRICEMISKPPDWMLDQGSKTSKYFEFLPRDGTHVPSPSSSIPPLTPPFTTGGGGGGKVLSVPRLNYPRWRIRTQQEYIAALSQREIKKKGGLSVLEKQRGNLYFKDKTLKDIVHHKGRVGTSPEDKNELELFVHFLYGILDPDPWKRWTAHQAAHHPFLIGGTAQKSIGTPADSDALKEENQAKYLISEIYYWEPPWDPNIYRRKHLNLQARLLRELTAQCSITRN